MISQPDYDVEVAVIGAGALGTAVAATLAPDHSVLVIERHEGSGRETSSHNSGVIHAGIYYPTGSLKHRACIEGNALLYEWCEQRNVVHRRCGKLIVALAGDEIDGLDAVVEQAGANGVPGISRLTGTEARALEPAVPAAGALLSASTGVVDQAGAQRVGSIRHRFERIFQRLHRLHGIPGEPNLETHEGKCVVRLAAQIVLDRGN